MFEARSKKQEARSKKQEARSKKLVTSLMLGAALMGTGLTTGLVYSNASQPITAEAKTKTKKVSLKKMIWKDGKWHTLTVNAPYGKTTKFSGLKYKGYVDIGGGNVTLTLDSKGKVFNWGGNQYAFMKKISATTQKANAKSKKAVTAKGELSYSKDNKYVAVPFTVKGLSGTLVQTSVPKVAGYTRSATTMKVGIMDKDALFSTYVYYTKNTSFGYKSTKATATKSAKSGTLKVNGTFAINNKTNAKKHPATYAVISDYKGKTYVKLNSKKAFNKSITKRAGAHKVSVTAAYRTKKSGSKSYTYHLISAPKSVTVKTTK